jgi:choline dehydrogenase-like flavoprotein
VAARAVVLAASACESARLLLNSKSRLFPEGLANSSGQVGRNLTDSVGSDGWGYIPALEKMPPHNHDGTGGMHLYIPWWKHDRQNDFPRGYHIELGGGRELPSAGMFNDVCDEVEGYGADLKATCRKRYGTTIGFAGRGEMVANPDTYCEIDPVTVDEWGIPVLRFHFKWSEYELRQAKDMQDTFKAITEAAGGEYRARNRIDGPYPFGIQPGGKVIHEVGTARIGADPKTSVLNGFCQAHDVKNLFVMDGAPLVTNPDKNPTLTIMALSWRASEYLLDEGKKGNL